MVDKEREVISRSKTRKARMKSDLIGIATKAWNDVVKPKIKDTIFNTIEFFIYGEVRGRGSGYTRTSNQVSWSDYTKMFNNPPQTAPSNQNDYRAGSRNQFDFKDVLFDSAEEAIDGFYQLKDILDREHRLTANRYYDVFKAKVRVPHTFEDFGWIDIGQSPNILECEGRYIIKLPQIRYIGRR